MTIGAVWLRPYSAVEARVAYDDGHRLAMPPGGAGGLRPNCHSRMPMARGRGR